MHIHRDTSRWAEQIFGRCELGDARRTRRTVKLKYRAGLARYFTFYNTRRRHSALDRRTPGAVYYEQVTPELAA